MAVMKDPNAYMEAPLNEMFVAERSPGDEARRLADNIRFRNMGGSLEGIEGFNLEYNDSITDFIGAGGNGGGGLVV